MQSKQKNSKKKKNKNATKKPKLSTVQEEMNLADIRNGFAWLKDGSFIGYLKVEGPNQSLLSEDQKSQCAIEQSALFNSIYREFSILAYPGSSASSEQLSLVERAIERERAASRSANTPAEIKRAALMMNILEEHMRPAAKTEAVGGRKPEIETYIALKFNKGEDAPTAYREMVALSSLAGGLARPSRILNDSEIKRLFTLYLTPSSVYQGQTEPFARTVLPT